MKSHAASLLTSSIVQIISGFSGILLRITPDFGADLVQPYLAERIN
jgi:hypothetical protein